MRYPFTVCAKLTGSEFGRLEEIAARWGCTRSEAIRRLIEDVRETDIYLGSP